MANRNRHRRVDSAVRDYVGNLWDRQEWDAPQGYLRLQAYLSMAPDKRSLAALAEDLQMSTRALERDCSDGRWVERAAAYDIALAVETRELAADVRRDMLLRHAEQARDVQATLRVILGRFHELLNDPAHGIDLMSVLPRTITRTTESGDVMRIRQEGLIGHIPAVVRALSAMATEERVASGAVGERVEVVGSVTAAGGMSEEDVNDIVAKLEAMVESASGGPR